MPPPWTPLQLTALQPQELVLPGRAMSGTSASVLRHGLRDPRVTTYRGASGQWDAEKTFKVGAKLRG
jgi:hypothetical protein